MTGHEHHQAARAAAGTTSVEIGLANCHDASELAGIERLLTASPGVRQVHLDRTRGVAHVEIDPARTRLEALQRAGYTCACAPAAVESPTEHRHAPDAHAGHGAHMVQDMLRRFIGSAILTLPIVLYSPLGTSLFRRAAGSPTRRTGSHRTSTPTCR